MSKTTKKKYVEKEILDNFELPTEEQEIVKVMESRGNNLHEVQDASGEKYLVSMPPKYRNNIWIKRGNFVVVEQIEEGDKVKAEIVNILMSDQIKYYKKQGKWPAAFEEPKDTDGSDHSDIDIFENPNRINEVDYPETDSSESD